MTSPERLTNGLFAATAAAPSPSPMSASDVLPAAEAPALDAGAVLPLSGLPDGPVPADLLGKAVQVTELNWLGENKDKRKVALSDGEHFFRALLGAAVDTAGEVKLGVVVRVLTAKLITMKTNRMLVPLTLEVLGDGAAYETIGSPVLVSTIPADGSQPAAPPTSDVAPGSVAAEPSAGAADGADEPAASAAADTEMPDAVVSSPEPAAKPTAADDASGVPAGSAVTPAPAPKPKAAAADDDDAGMATVEKSGESGKMAEATPAKRERDDGASAGVLSAGAILRLYEAAGDQKAVNAVLTDSPLFQIASIKKVEGAAIDKFKVNLSDGKHYMPAVLTPRLNSLIRGAEGGVALQQYGTIRVTAAICNVISGRRVMVVSGMEVTSAAPLACGLVGQPAFADAALAPADTLNTPTPAAPPGGASGLTEAAERGSVHPIAAIRPTSRRVSLKVRATVVDPVRTFQRGEREGKVLNVELCDESGEIRATLWNEAVDKYVDVLEEGGVYHVWTTPAARAPVKMANKKFATGSNPYELSLDGACRIERVAEAAAGGAGAFAALQPMLSLTAVSGLPSKPTNAAVDVIGVIADVGALTSITHKASGREVSKRTVTIADASGEGGGGSTVEVALWDSQAEKVGEAMAPSDGHATVLCLKGVRISDWNRRSLATNRGTQVSVDPPRDEAEAVRAWWLARDGSAQLEPVSVNERAGGPNGAGGAGGDRLNENRIDLEMAHLDSPLGAEAGAKPVWCSARGYVLKLQLGENRPLWYPACPSCNKKMTGDEETSFYCEGCSQSHAEAQFRYILSGAVVDATGRAWVSLFNETSEKLLGMKANDLRQLREISAEKAEAEFRKLDCAGPFNMRLKLKREDYNNEPRLRVTLIEAVKVDYAAEARVMLAQLQGAKLT